jgi:uncharacterized protein (TIGR00725 family)
MTKTSRRPILGVIGNAGTLPLQVAETAKNLGCLAIDAGFRLVTGGLDGIMEAVSEGAHDSAHYQEGMVLGIIPSYAASQANRWVDIVIPTGMQMGRNILVVASADVVIAIGGGSGTLSEIALAWQLGKPIIGLSDIDGWGEKLSEQVLDERHNQPIISAKTPSEAIQAALKLLEQPRKEPGDIDSGWIK